MDQKKASSILRYMGIMLLVFGILISILGLSLLFAENKSEVEFWLLAMFLISGAGLLVGGFNMIQKAKTKATEVTIYQSQVYQALEKQRKSYNQESSNVKNHNTQVTKELHAKNISATTVADDYTPDIIASLNYTPAEWKLMSNAETKRRFIEGIWVSLLVGLLGGWVIGSSRGESFMFAFLYSLGVGVLIAVLKVYISTNMFALKKENTIHITSNALLINDKFQTLSDSDIHLQYVKAVIDKEFHFIEFSLQWQTRRGATNDQFRILIPDRYKEVTEKVIEYYRAKGVKIEMQ